MVLKSLHSRLCSHDSLWIQLAKFSLAWEVRGLEDLVMEFITEMTHKCMEIGRPGRVQVEDIIFLVRKQPRMYARVRELLTMNEELKKARKAFDEVKYVQGGK